MDKLNLASNEGSGSGRSNCKPPDGAKGPLDKCTTPSMSAASPVKAAVEMASREATSKLSYKTPIA